MAQVYPDAMRDVALNNANQNGGINTPPEEDFDTQAMQGSMQQFLADNLGEYVVVEFLIGTQTMEQKRGILYAVGRSVMTLYEEESQTFVMCDIFSVKFVTFYPTGRRPGQITVSMDQFVPILESPGDFPGISMPAPGRAKSTYGYRTLSRR